MKFGPWEISDNEYLESAERMERAGKISPANIESIDTESGSACMIGSDGFPYCVTLHGCDCVDFERRGLPCKHMIRLALELGLQIDVPQYDPVSAYNYNVEEDIERLTARWQAGQLTLEALSKCSAALRASAKQARRPRGRPKKTQ